MRLGDALNHVAISPGAPASLGSIASLLILALAAGSAVADDPGISTARLIEEEPGRYLLEIDASSLIVGAFRPPVLPARFMDSLTTEYDRQDGFILIRYRFAHVDEPLKTEDEILLPWARLAASITVQWSDGEVHKALFPRSFAGIPVPIARLMPVRESRASVLRKNLILGVEHIRWAWPHWLLVAAMVLAAGTSAWRLWLALVIGRAVAMVLADLGATGSPLGFVEVILTVVVLLQIRAKLTGGRQKGRFGPVLMSLGILHGLAYARVLDAASLESEHRVLALFGFAAGVALAEAALVAMGAGLAVIARRRPRGWSGRILAYSLGIVAVVAGLDGLLQGPPGVAAIRAAHPIRTQEFVLPTSGGAAVAGAPGQPRQPRQFDEPVAVFLTIEPYELRAEFLIRVADLSEWTGMHPGTDGVILPDAQPALVDSLLALLRRGTRLTVDGRDVAPARARGDFVTAEPTGSLTRVRTVPEDIREAVVGLTFIYESNGLPKELALDLQLFGTGLPQLRATWTDPFGARETVLSADASALIWSNQLTGYEVPRIEAVMVESPRWPLPSLALFVGIAGVAGWGWRRGRAPHAQSIGAWVLALAFVLYPFIRVPLQLTKVGLWKPSPEEASVILDGLLTNVYRSFDLREEEEVYDRLARTVTGGELTEIYLQGRRALELENRGGARGRVDAVEVLEVGSVKRGEAGALAVDVTWKVSGSVSHFGHTHYRQNRNRAMVHIVPQDSAWKIRAVETIDEQRLL